ANLRGSPRRNLADPFHAPRIARAFESGDRFNDPTAKSDDPTVYEVSVHPDCEGGPHWIVEWGDGDGGCYVTTFDGPRHSMAQWPSSERTIILTRSRANG